MIEIRRRFSLSEFYINGSQFGRNGQLVSFSIKSTMAIWYQSPLRAPWPPGIILHDETKILELYTDLMTNDQLFKNNCLFIFLDLTDVTCFLKRR